MGIPAGKRREEIRRLLLESGDRVLSAGELAARFTYGTNARASAEFRRHVAGVLIGRALKEIGEVK